MGSYSVFYDLETSDSRFVGQILNYAFVALDPDYQIVDQLTGLIRISRLQIPRPGAILANRINVLEHQKTAVTTEVQAMQDIRAFLDNQTRRSFGKSLALIGYNSDNFDLPYLRTSMIRSGVNPYAGQLAYRDMLSVSRYLFATNCDFRKIVSQTLNEKGSVSLRLESLCHAFNLLTGRQKHESLADVELAIALARIYAEKFDTDIRTFRGYQVAELHKHPKGTAVMLAEPQIGSLSEQNYIRNYPAVLLDANDKYALWIDLDKYRELRDQKDDVAGAIRWKKYAEHVVLPGSGVIEKDVSLLGADALDDLSHISLKNYFQDADCDLEQHIYRFPINKLEALKKAFATGTIPVGAGNDFKQLLQRFLLENTDGILTGKLRESLIRYVNYRYGGNLILDKSTRNQKEDKRERHFKIENHLTEIDEIINNAEANEEDKDLARALKRFTEESEVYKIWEAGRQTKK